MPINLLLIPFVIILGLVYGQKESNKRRLSYIIICSAVLLFVAAMRSPEWMTFTYHIDSLNYQENFERTVDMSWQEVLNSLYLRYYLNIGDYDIGYIALSKLISIFTKEFAFFSLFADLLFFVPFGYLLYRFTTKTIQVVFAFVFYISLVQIFLLGGARQIFAIGLHMMALVSAIDKKKLRTVLFLLLGISIHFSSFVFVLPVLLAWNDLKPRTLKVLHILAFVAFPAFFLIPNELIEFMGDAVGMEKYAEYGSNEIQGGGSVFIILIELLSLFCLFAINVRGLSQNRAMSKFYVMAPFFTVFAPLIRSNGTLIRMSLYFHLFLVLLIPFAIDCFFPKNSRNIAYVAVISALALLALAGGSMTYYFYWQV